ncbi:putative hemin transport protein [Faunimonas pinastri]|uniref:Putative hemin transport protein n=1 Tax=Faunimonas pinastri TaxID=1855383 RepID=A0A1H9LZT6_9HYPH|nr:ChuX/HutX family heme-like substrate-binding protein [Faunimonas pinastri]SER16928.1 putative hemin transport protein [Faunimonas pinastri]
MTDIRGIGGSAPKAFFQSGMRSRDLAAEMGISEAELLADHEGPEVSPLRLDAPALLAALPTLGEVMCLTRNEVAVHEKVGTFGVTRLSDHAGFMRNGELDLRLFPKVWSAAFAVELPGDGGPRRSLQIFDRHGDAAVKVHLRPSSDVAAFDEIRLRFAIAAPLRLDLSPAPVAPLAVAQPEDPEGFLRSFQAMTDVHQFFPLLKRHDLARRQALSLLDGTYAARLTETAPRLLMERAAGRGQPIMCFVGSRGCIQIHSGPIQTVKPVGPWLNILDPGFNLHLREDLVAEAWRVRKPSRFGFVTSVELYDAAGSLVTQFFGVRDEDKAEDPNWNALAESLPEMPR